MSEQLSPKELDLLLRAVKMAGADPNDPKIQPKNPHTLKGPLAEKIQQAAAVLNPELNGEWMRAVGQSPVSLSAAAAQAGVIPMTKDFHQQLMNTDPKYREGFQKKQAAEDAEAMAAMERATADLERQRVDAERGPGAYDRQKANEGAQQERAEAERREVFEMEQRIRAGMHRRNY